MTTWPHNTDPKQTKSLFQNVLVHRCDDVSLTREDECLQLLLKGDAAICIGLPGIGKSVSTTAMLVKALEMIVQRHRTSPGETLPDDFDIETHIDFLGVNDMSLANPDGLRFKDGAGDAQSLDWWQKETQKKTKSSLYCKRGNCPGLGNNGTG